jgi:SAM-dependent methyltransferase
MLMAPPLTLNAWLRYDLAARLLRSLHGIESVLEIGAGEGALGWRFARQYRYVGLEPDAASFAKAQRRLSRLPGATVRNIPVERLHVDQAFDLVCAFEVLEHVEDDRKALETWQRLMRPGGWMLLSVPAWPKRWGALDEKAGHYRRYDPRQMADLLQEAGFVAPVLNLYGFPLTYLLQPAWNLFARPALMRDESMEQRTARSGRWLQPPDALGFLTRALSLPFRLVQRPFARTNLGTGLVVLAQRPPVHP